MVYPIAGQTWSLTADELKTLPRGPGCWPASIRIVAVIAGIDMVMVESLDPGDTRKFPTTGDAILDHYFCRGVRG